jgi:hypothetical protein
MDILMVLGELAFRAFSFSLFMFTLAGWPYIPLAEWVDKKFGCEEVEEYSNIISLERRAA